MNKKQCIVCQVVRGRRVCKVRNKELICPVCCAKNRDEKCEGCSFYSEANKYKREKEYKKELREGPEKFIARLDPDVDEEVDQILALASEGQLDRAEREMRKVYVKNPDLAMVHYGMGVIFAMKGDEARALPYFDSAVKIFPIFAEAWFNKATIHQRKLEMYEMILAFQQVLKCGDKDEEYYGIAKDMLQGLEKNTRETMGLDLDGFLKMAKIYKKAFDDMGKKEYSQAIKGFKEVLRLEPNHVQSYGNIGLCLGFLGRVEEGRKALEKALEIDPDYEPAKVNLQTLNKMKEGQVVDDPQVLVTEFYKEKLSKSKKNNSETPF